MMFLKKIVLVGACFDCVCPEFFKRFQSLFVINLSTSYPMGAVGSFSQEKWPEH
jgi:hypothetical protein